MALGREYTAIFVDVAVSAQQDLFQITTLTNVSCELLEFHLSQSSEVGDVQEESLSILLKGDMQSNGSGGTTPTSFPLSLGDPGSSAIVEANNTTKGSATLLLGSWNWNIRLPLDVIFTLGRSLAPSNGMIIELATTPADSITVSGWIKFREIG